MFPLIGAPPLEQDDVDLGLAGGLRSGLGWERDCFSGLPLIPCVPWSNVGDFLLGCCGGVGPLRSGLGWESDCFSGLSLDTCVPWSNVGDFLLSCCGGVDALRSGLGWERDCFSGLPLGTCVPWSNVGDFLLGRCGGVGPFEPTKKLILNNSYMIYIIRNPILWLGISTYGGRVFVSLFFERRCSPDYFFRNVNTSFFFHWHLFFYFISNDNCRLLTINIVSFIFFYYRESKPPFCLHYEKSSPVNIVSRKINWQSQCVNHEEMWHYIKVWYKTLTKMFCKNHEK
jgi:hypothetical protein